MNESDESDKHREYIKPNIEMELPKEKRQTCRDIVQEIKNFGVSQRQILYIIQLLSMELENREVMLALVKTIGEQRNKLSSGNRLILQEEQPIKKKLIT
jgi:hypothetical protein